MFSFCSSIKNLDVTKFNTTEVTDMTKMFYNCSNLTSLEISKFDTSKVKNMDQMFSNCYNLNYLDFSSFNTSECNGLVGIVDGIPNLTVYMEKSPIVENLIEEINKTKAKIDFINK